MSDDFSKYTPGLDSPARSGAAVTPNDSADLSYTSRALYVGVGGDIKVMLAGDTVAVTFANVPSGSILPVRVARVYATGTDATTIIALR